MGTYLTIEDCKKAIKTLSGFTDKGMAREATWAFILTDEEIDTVWKAIVVAKHAYNTSHTGFAKDTDLMQLDYLKDMFYQCKGNEKASPFKRG